MLLQKSLLAGLILLPAINLFAQTDKTPPICTPEYSRLLVAQQAAESKMVEATDKRVRILLRASEFLWKLDESHARKLFQEAFETAEARFKEKGFESKKIGATGMARMNIPDYRMEVVAAIAKRDGEWAKRLTEQILQNFEKDRENRRPENVAEEVSSLLRIAQEVAAANPALSQHLFRRAMRYPLDSHWHWALYGLAKDNRSAADSLYLELLQNYRDETPRRLLFLSAYPFAAERIFGPDKYQYGAFPPPALAPNPRFQVRFFDVFWARVGQLANDADEINRRPEPNRLPEAAYIVVALNDIEPIVAQNFPSLLERLALARAQGNSLLSDEAKQAIEAQKKLYADSVSSFDDRLERLKKADLEGKLRDIDIIRLIFGLKKESEFREAEGWLGKIQDAAARRETENYFYFKRSQNAREDKRFDDAGKYAARVEEIEHRAVLLFEIAGEKLKLTKEPTAIMDILAEVSQMARRADDSVEKAQVALGLASMYEKVNHTIALNELSEAIKIINRLENPDIFSNSVFRKIEGQGYGFYAVFSTPGYNLETTFNEISRHDFELAIAHATNLGDRHFRTLAVIAAVKNCVEKNQSKPKTVKK